MEIKNFKLIEDDFVPAFEELMYKQMPAKQCLELATCLDEIVTHVGILRQTRKTIVLKHATKDGKQESAQVTEGTIIFPTPEAKQACTEETLEIMNEAFEIPLTERIKIKDSDLSTPRKMRLLSDVIEIVEDEKPEEEKKPGTEEKA